MDSRSQDVSRTLCGVARRTYPLVITAKPPKTTWLTARKQLFPMIFWESYSIGEALQYISNNPGRIQRKVQSDWNMVFPRLSCHFPPFPAKLHHKFLFFHRRIQPSVAVRLQELKSWCILVHQCEGLTITPQRLRRRSTHKCMTPLKKCGLI